MIKQWETQEPNSLMNIYITITYLFHISKCCLLFFSFQLAEATVSLIMVSNFLSFGSVIFYSKLLQLTLEFFSSYAEFTRTTRLRLFFSYCVVVLSAESTARGPHSCGRLEVRIDFRRTTL